MLLFPEGDPRRRRHAHTACVLRARAAGRLPLKEDCDGEAAGRAGLVEAAARPTLSAAPRACGAAARATTVSAGVGAALQIGRAGAVNDAGTAAP